MTPARGVKAAKGSTRVAVVNGPNMNLLGLREPAHYGSATLADIEGRLVTLGQELGLQVTCFQSNHEGELIEHVQALRGQAGGLVINAGGYSHTSIALRDAVVFTDLPVVEVHLSNVFARESFRHHSYLSEVARGLVCGFGPMSYELGLRAMVELIRA